MIPLAGYDYIGPLGTPGNFGTVHHACNILSGQAVAIKHIDEALSHEALAAWKAEAQAMAACEHEHVVRILHAEITPDGPALVMEFLPEGSVAAKYGDDAAPVGEVVDLAIDACWGLHRLHTASVTHRDIKPANLLLDGGRVKLADFGLAAGPSEPVDMIYVAHKPPELRAGDPWTESADIYALAVTVWRLLWGDANCGRHDPDIAARAIAGDWPDRDAWPTHVHKRLRTALRAALHPDPSRRPETAADFRSALEQARPAVSWTQVASTRWVGASVTAHWEVQALTQGDYVTVEAKRDTGNGLRRVGAGCSVTTSGEEARASCAEVLERLASDGTL